ncbi:MAG: CopD family protein [Candidatus Rokubacteria bacterium]|nr:CopD family protein [Candidatus Rokubacteria bacterium]
MRLLPLWLHVVSAAVWLGGLLFQSHILLPLLAGGGPAEPVAQAVRRSRRVAWTALALLILTGLHNLTRLPPVASMIESGVLKLLALKLFLVVVLLMLSAHRDFGVAARLIRAVAEGRDATQALRTLVKLDRVALLLGVGLVYLGLALSRGGVF